jgi:hypothetical protein
MSLCNAGEYKIISTQTTGSYYKFKNERPGVTFSLLTQVSDWSAEAPSLSPALSSLFIRTWHIQLDPLLYESTIAKIPTPEALKIKRTCLFITCSTSGWERRE